MIFTIKKLYGDNLPIYSQISQALLVNASEVRYSGIVRLFGVNSYFYVLFFIRCKRVDKKVLFSGEVEKYFSASPQIKVFCATFLQKRCSPTSEAE